jgi:hypothetical protein
MFALLATHLGNTRLSFIDISANKEKKVKKIYTALPKSNF